MVTAATTRFEQDSSSLETFGWLPTTDTLKELDTVWACL